MPDNAPSPSAPQTTAVASSYLNRSTPGVYITEGAVTAPRHANAITAHLKTDCEMVGLDLIDEMVRDLGVIRDSKGADITDKVQRQLQTAWTNTFNFTLNHQRSNRVTHTKPVDAPAKDALELIARLKDSRDTMSGMMNRVGIQADSWSPARTTLHTEVMGRYDGMIATLTHRLWGYQVAPTPAASPTPG